MVLDTMKLLCCVNNIILSQNTFDHLIAGVGMHYCIAGMITLDEDRGT